ncbi:hypothetical protein [Pararhodobacter aggregans]|uniref:hypothetical protein n=1 Tax=Pararhodobacter aggregans TaxID=404875 RepID=UPI003A8CB4E3
MNISRKTRSFIAGVLTAATLLLSPAAQAQDFRGGGLITNFTGCSAQGWSGSEFVRARLRLAASTSSGRNSLSLFLPDGAINLDLPEPMTTGGAPRRFWGAATWEEFGAWDPRPRMNYRQVRAIGGPTPATAQDLLLQIRVRAFNWMPGCEVTMMLALTRV